MRFTLIILVLLIIGLPSFGIELIPDDATFSKAVTMDSKGESLSDVVKVLSKAAGVSIRASEDVADQKVTILVDSMSIRDVMNGIATLYGWSWAVKASDDGDTYIIYDPLRTKREADRKEALDKAWKALGEKLDSLSYDAESADSIYDSIALLQYRSLSPRLREAFLSGMHIWFRTESPVPDYRPSQVVTGAFNNVQGRIQGMTSEERKNGAGWEPDLEKPSSVMIKLSSVVGSNTIAARSLVFISYDPPDSDESDIMPIMRNGGEIDLCVQEINYPQEDLKNILPNKPADELLGKKASISTADVIAEGAAVGEGTSVCFATRTDLLTALHNKLGLQIISDYYSSWSPFQDVQDITVKQLIEEKRFPGLPADWGWDGKVLYMRVKDIRTADSREIPNRLLRPWQAVVKRQGFRGIEELAQAAAFLSNEQRQAISEDCFFLRLGKCKEIDDPGGWDNAVLRFYGLLTTKQKKNIFIGEVGVMELTLEQRSALAALLYSSNFLHTGLYNKDGLNMDEPQFIRGMWNAPVVKVQMTCSGSFIYVKPGDDVKSLLLRVSPKATPDEAMAEAKARLGEDADPQNVVAMGDIIYTLSMRDENYSYEESTPKFAGWLGVSEHSSHHRLKIKVPEKQR